MAVREAKHTQRRATERRDMKIELEPHVYAETETRINSVTHTEIEAERTDKRHGFRHRSRQIFTQT